MPKNWKTYKFSDFALINPSIQLKRGIEHPYIEMKDLDSNSKYALSKRYRELKGGSRFQNGDTLCARISPCLENGKICQAKLYEGQFGYGSTEFLVFRGKENISDSEFIYYVSRSPQFRTFSENRMIGTSGRQRIAKEAYEDFIFNVPDLPEQRAIASILSALDDKIENNLAMNKTLEDMAMALYKHWFVDFGPFQEGKFIDSELGLIPEGWEIKELGELVKILGGYAFKGKDFKDVGESVIKIKNISNNLVSIEGSNCIAGQVAEKTNPKFQISPGSFLVAMTGAEVGKVGVVPNYGRRMWLNQRVGMITKPAFKHADILVGIFLQGTEGYEIIQNLAYGSAQPNISSSGIESISIVIPNDLSIIIDELNQMNNWHLQRISNYTENQTLSQLRDTLLPKLISGEVRLKEFEEEITAAL